VAKPSSSSSPEELSQYIESLEEALVGIHGFVTGALARSGTWVDDDAREAFSQVQAQVERVLPEVLELKAMMEQAGGTSPSIH
jgi:trehalose-6-phosphatase